MKTDNPRGHQEHGTRRIFMGLVCTVAMAAVAARGGYPELPVNLGEAAHFTILSGAAITSAGGDLYGDAGASPITGAAIGLIPSQMKDGIIYAVDAFGPAGSVIDPTMLGIAKGDLTTAFNDAAGRTTPTATYAAPAGELGGLTLAPGLYKFDGTAELSIGDLTLAGGANDVWIFQIATALNVGTYRKVLLSGGALAKNVFWQVGSSATLGTYSDFKGTIMADQQVVLGVGSKLEGRALARIAQVVFDGVSATLPLDLQVTIVSPPNGAQFWAPTPVDVLVSATSSPYPVSTVQLSIVGYLGTNWVGTTSTAPYQFVWPSIPGDYVLTAIVWDTEDNTATSLPVTITVISPLWVDAVPLPGGWRWLSWFGFFEEDGYWIWHYDHGWMYPVGTTTEDILFYTGDMEWIWSSGSVYPWIYRFSDSTWLWYLRDSAAPRWFYNATTESWEMH